MGFRELLPSKVNNARVLGFQLLLGSATPYDSRSRMRALLQCTVTLFAFEI